MLKFILAILILTNSIVSFGKDTKDSLQSSVSFCLSFGMMYAPSQNAISFLSSYNPSYNLKYNRFELGLGIDYYRYTFKLGDEYSIDNIYSFSTYLRSYFFKKQFLYAELFLNTGYWESKGDLEIYEGNQFISTYGLGIGLVIPPLRRCRDHKFLKHLYWIINYRESFVHRDIRILQTDVNMGLIYRF